MSRKENEMSLWADVVGIFRPIGRSIASWDCSSWPYGLSRQAERPCGSDTGGAPAEGSSPPGATKRPPGTPVVTAGWCNGESGLPARRLPPVPPGGTDVSGFRQGWRTMCGRSVALRAPRPIRVPARVLGAGGGSFRGSSCSPPPTMSVASLCTASAT